MKPKWLLIFVALVLIGGAPPRVASADAIFNVSVDTSLLSGPYSLFFQLTDGSGVGNATNTATLDQFLFGGGSPSLDPPVGEGGFSGNLGTSVILTDTLFFNYFSQGFTPGALLSFRLRLTTENEPGGTPDTFAFSILDLDGFPIPTPDPSGASTLLTIQLTAADPLVENFGVGLTQVNPVPEPGTLVLMAVGLAGAAGRRLRRRR